MGLITLTTDFGSDSPYVAQMKGVISGLSPHATIVDVTHGIGPQNIGEAAWVLGDVVPAFPCDAIHVVVVDPGVGSDRSLVAARFPSGTFVAPDNGLLTRVALRARPLQLIRLTVPEFWRPHVSGTFHGRDIMAPVAAHLASGVALERLGAVHGELQMLRWPTVEKLPNGLAGHVMYVDSFGNLITNISREDLAACPEKTRLKTTVGDRELLGLASHYAVGTPGQPVALIGSRDQFEVAIINGHAADSLRINVGDPVRLSWSP